MCQFSDLQGQNHPYVYCVLSQLQDNQIPADFAPTGIVVIKCTIVFPLPGYHNQVFFLVEQSLVTFQALHSLLLVVHDFFWQPLSVLTDSSTSQNCFVFQTIIRVGLVLQLFVKTLYRFPSNGCWRLSTTCCVCFHLVPDFFPYKLESPNVAGL